MRQIILVLTIGIAVSISAFSQIPFEKYRSNEGYSYALTEAEKELDSPELIGIATVTGDYSYQQLEFHLEFDETEGKSTAWLYIFRSSVEPDSAKSWIVIKPPLVGYMALLFDMFDLSIYTSFFADEKIDIENCLNSKQMMDSIAKNENYAKIVADTSWGLRVAGLGVGANDLVFEKGKPFWLATFANETDRMNCYVHGETGETICMTFASVETLDNDSQILQVYPNPSSGRISVTLPETHQGEIISYRIYSINGIMFQSAYNIEINTKEIAIECPALSQGLYFIVIQSNNNKYSGTFYIINK